MRWQSVIARAINIFLRTRFINKLDKKKKKVTNVSFTSTKVLRNACLVLLGDLSNISRWFTVGIEPCSGRIRNLLEFPRKLFPLIFSSSLDISSHPVRNTRIAPSFSWRQMYSIVASTYMLAEKREDKKFSEWQEQEQQNATTYGKTNNCESNHPRRKDACIRINT